tara:strand:- start:1241 stop:1972 length:732 start_codon:yes stop_codon:yes gene_type:complete
MSLPILETATYELTLPSIDQKIKYRPFLVKEEKVLMMAMESGNQSEIKTALKNIVQACTFGEINASLLPTFDLEYVFLQIRSKSIGEIAKIKVLCPDDKETYAPIELDLSKVEVLVDDSHTNEVQINDKLKIVMKYPTIDSVDATADAENMKTEQLFDIVGNSIHQIEHGDEVHMAKDYTKKELQDFIESLASVDFGKIQKFFTSMPALKHEVEVTNPKTNITSKVTLSGLADFFQSPSPTTT